MNVRPRFEGSDELNVLGEALQPCSSDPLTGFYRNGYCSSGIDKASHHLVCVEVTAEFLAYSQSAGNDLTTARPEFAFPGLHPGDRWCLVAERWVQALAAGMAPRVVLRSTNQAVLGRISLADLKAHALDLN
jgi:uncharacterized protein